MPKVVDISELHSGELIPVMRRYYASRMLAFRGLKPYRLAGFIVVPLWLSLCFVFLKPTIAGVESWRLPLVYFPHINFSRPRVSDLFRFLIQLCWVIVVRQSPPARTRIGVDGAEQPSDEPLTLLWRFISKCKALLFANVLTRSMSRYIQQLESQSTTTSKTPSKKPVFLTALARTLVGVLLVILALMSFTVPLTVEDQFIFVSLLFLLAYALNRVPGHLPLMLMVGISLLVSGRYVWWRCTSTLNFDDPIGLVFGIGLLMAEAYAWLVMLLGYVQNIRPLHRGTVTLPADSREWPSVDIMIPSYNEDLSVVRATVYACLGLDWPKEKLHIHILDDGKRDSFKDFAAEVGVGYIRRPTNNHAKAGNINYALAQTSGEYVAIFDCDHIPTRVFLQISMGWFLKDPKLALIQTPHHFFSPDPFERNLSNFRKVPNEGGLFYGLIQDGNDLWNSTFFCGSCAILRRGPLEEVGGIAVETVTEDAHTSLRLHRRGYHSAYLRAPLSAGLATETLSAHIGQRIRWARGMAQILRTDNPLFGPGLKWQQRLCYLNAMLHFLSGIPRLIFLTAPLAFLIFHAYVIYAPAMVLVLYVLPHILHSSITNSRMQGKYRYSFWGEVYEVVLSWYIARPTTVALFAPKKGSFNVTAKGGLVENSYYDWVISKPYMFLVLANFIGLGFGLYRYFNGPENEIGAVIVNMTWTLYNVLIIGSAVAVASEMKQVRRVHRVDTNIPAKVRLNSGHLIQATVMDFSLEGLRVAVQDMSKLPRGQFDIDIILMRANREFTFPMRSVYTLDNAMGLHLKPLSTEQMTDFVQCTFARADTWVKWQDSYEYDRPMASMAAVFRAAVYGYRRLFALAPRPLPDIARWLVRRFKYLSSFSPRKALPRAEQL
ncbi:UDP-forming cellulose synthase catalytic subunit [uncultured Zhongshania sp.]|jgi:cellulose synthase (UDP-forming)|uniref:UDP-forming cellulose synthase catalytic subunit n=1 Tax=uncultured Zhongshania sp. TaxID=1642288 RepID=UPI0030D93763|tara:strand:+ start:9957 stop:12617 length:2661 start_codon:yes stop_codon:yes gene_type:complete